MTARQTPCGKCGAAVVLARALNGGTFALEPYPDPSGRYEVVVRDGSLVVLGRTRQGVIREAGSKEYEPHSATCTPASKAAPREGRPQQLTIGDQP